jgi:hypothetical protein
MAVNLSPVAGVAGQFFDNNGNPLSGGKLYTYTAGTTTPQATYTSSSGGTAHSNPIVLDSGGRVPGGEIWLTNGQQYKFVLNSSVGALIGTWDNVFSVNASLDTALAASSGSSLVGYLPAGTGAVAATVQAKLRESVSVNDFGAVGDGVTNDTPAIQLALTASPVIRLIPGKTYYLATPIKVSGGEVIYSEAGRLAGYVSGRAVLKPATCAIQTSDYQSQNIGFTLRNVGFIGGTLQVDLGLFHEVEVTSCEFKDPSIGGLMITRGEKHLITRNRFDCTTGNPTFAMALGRWQESLNPGVGAFAYSDAYFGSPGSWFDRATVTNNVCQSGGGTFKYSILSNTLSGSVISDLVAHGNSALGGELGVIYVRDIIQQCVVSCIAPDAGGSVASPMPNVFYFGQILNCTFENVSPQFSGTSKYVNGIYSPICGNSTFIGCRADGDNVTTYGFYFGSSTGQNTTLISCSGAIYHASTSVLIREQLALINCVFPTTNVYSSNSNIVNKDIDTLLMADTNGTTAATSKWSVTFASGGGGNRVPFYIKKDATWFPYPVAFTNAFGESFGQTIQPTPTNNTSPEGLLTANPGSLCLFYNGTTSGALYVKQTGVGNTGWVLK